MDRFNSPAIRRSILTKIAVVFSFLTFVSITAVPADEVIVVMTTGERFVSNEVWEEVGKIRFSMQGLMVSVKKEEVAEIIRGPNGTKRIDPPPVYQQKSGNGVAAGSPLDRLSMKPSLDPLHPGTDRASGRTRGPTTATRQLTDDAHIGMDGLVWRMSSGKIEGLEKIETDPAFGGIDQHWRPEQPLVFGNVELNGLVYGFWHDQLYSILMWADGRAGYDRMRTEVFNRFGPGRQRNPNSERHIWVGEETQRMLEFDSQRNSGIFIMRAARLHDQMRHLYPD